ncbi:conserved hypothetical protein [Pediculus humanus corporis]|uniref:Protein male-specific lethal-3 n=1 Tax=Pediculus humanus subsp. corporis TaxID=121224 RepID=E0VX04_PEDHC|nr:uncharacterized protein Phum_PHUM492390 [Pediculus humanus corporis]EEB17910.1 conserved hypothetical protein [Pediculus humanus corporis]
MVSTRGNKYKFTDGERVLCYEPDPTKAKVLYDSKVLEVIVGKDEKGRKNVEYLIHFQGWNSSWDRCVSEDYVLKDTEENRKLQKDLADKAQLQLGAYLYRRDRKKRSRTLSQKINEAWDSGTNSCSSKKSQDDNDDLETTTEDDELGEDGDIDDGNDDDDDDDDEDDGDDNDDDDDDNDDDEEVENGNDKNKGSLMDTDDILDERIPLDLSNQMKAYLEEDYNLINNELKVVILPASPTVLEILESYIKHCGVKQPNESESKSQRRTRSHFQDTREVDPMKDFEAMVARLNLCKEIVDGLRIYFDFTLGQLLLYDYERPQFEDSRTESKEYDRDLRIPFIKQEPYDSLSEDDTSQNVSQSSADNNNTDIRIESETIDSERKRSLRSHREPVTSNEPTCSLIQSSQPVSNNGIGKLTIRNLGSLGTGNHSNILSNNHCSTKSTSSTSSYYSPLVRKITTKSSCVAVNVKIAKLMDHASSWKIVPESYLNEKPRNPSTLYGAVHLARLFVKLPTLLHVANQPEKENQPRVLSERKLKALIHHLQLFLTYLESKPEWFGEKHYTDNVYLKSEKIS